jgi:hypothetical protein
MRNRIRWLKRRRGSVVVLGALIAALSAINAQAATPPSLRATVCVDTASPPHLAITQTWKNAGPADFAGMFDIVYTFQYGPSSYESIDRQYVANAGQMVSGTQTDTFNAFIGESGPVPWNTYFRVDATWVVNGTTTVSDVVTQPKNGWRTCK